MMVMAERVDSFPAPTRAPATNWAKWADGHEYMLTRGVDFTQTPAQARKAFLSWASRHRMHCHTSVVEGNGRNLWVQAWSR